MEKGKIYNIIYNLLKIKFGSKIYNDSFELEKAKKDFEIQIDNLTNNIFENYFKTDYLSLDFIKGLHKSVYPEGTTIRTYRDGKYYANLVGEYRLHENTHEEDNHHHSLQINIETDLINYTNHYNSIKNKKRTDILKYYFDFLRVHPFADSNLTIISIICELEFLKYGFKSLDFLKTRFEDGKFNYFFLYEYENNKNEIGILDEIEKIIDDFHKGELSNEIIEKKEEINIKPTSELFLGKDKKINFDNTSYFIELNQIIENNFINISENLSDYDVRKIVYNNTLSYLKNALLRTTEEKHDIVFGGYNDDMERIIAFCQKKIISNPFFKLSSNIIKELHKTLYPNGFIQKNKNINGKEFIQMIPGEYRTINLVAKTSIDKNLYYKWQEVENGLRNLISDFNNSKKQINDILLFMSDFLTIHPFGDGNGRVVDILVDLLLLKEGFKPLSLGLLKQKDEIGFYEIRNKIYETRDIGEILGFVEKYQKN